MEELRSTEVLDKEIESDARKKAERILSKADLDSKVLIDGVAARTDAAKKERTAVYQKKIDAYEKDLNASVPLEKERFLVSFVDSKISEGIGAYISSLSIPKKISLLMKQLDTYSAVISGKKMNALVYGFKIDDVKKALEEKLGKSLISCTSTDAGHDPYEGIILESDDKNVRCRLTLAEIIEELQAGKRAELASALFGGRLSE